MAVVENPDGAGIAAVYKEWAREHQRQALIDFRNHRPLRSGDHTGAAKKLLRAASAEQVDPPPGGRPITFGEGPDGKAQAEVYRARARELEGRDVALARTLNRAAWAEETNPVPPGLTLPLLPPGDQPEDGEPPRQAA